MRREGRGERERERNEHNPMRLNAAPLHAETRLLRCCSNGCITTFHRNPAKKWKRKGLRASLTFPTTGTTSVVGGQLFIVAIRSCAPTHSRKAAPLYEEGMFAGTTVGSSTSTPEIHKTQTRVGIVVVRPRRAGYSMIVCQRSQQEAPDDHFASDNKVQPRPEVFFFFGR
jgi:hypothetical protein